MNPRPRNLFIDYLRGISMAAVISLHALANYLNDPFVLQLWDVQQFAVQVFVFCSAYLFFSRPPEIHLSSFVGYFVKRFWRLYKPYLLYALALFAAMLLLKPEPFTWKGVVQALTLTGYLDISWLVLLFVEFIPLFVLIHVMQQKSHFLFNAYIFTTVYTAIFIFLMPFPYNWKWFMWLPWSFLAIYAIFYKRFEDDFKQRVFSYILAAGIFAIALCIQTLARETHFIYLNKYPPTIILLSYGILWIGIFDFLNQQGVFEKLHLTKPLSFLSRYSYPLFFIHYFLIYVFNNGLHLNRLLPWWGYMLVLFPAAIGVQVGLNWVGGLKKF